MIFPLEYIFSASGGAFNFCAEFMELGIWAILYFVL